MAESHKKKDRNSKTQGEVVNVKVAVRVRPFNELEVSSKERPCVYMSGKTVAVVNKQGKNKSFTYDYSYWSLSRTGPNEYADQERIFQDLGLSFINNAFDGYNSSVFAYGQTGSGKSYTMMGTPSEPGMIPRGCDEIFRRIRSSSVHYEVEASYMEVYLDRIYDLLQVQKKKSGRGSRQKLPIRFHPKTGAFVEGLTKHAVENFNDVRNLLRAGIHNRTIAATAMNKISSRSHSIFTLYIHHHRKDGKIRTSKINLIDLAGSERVSKSLAEGQRMEELKKINRSLSALGDVIHALASGAKFVPYNNSVLTTLLKESLGGNAKTIMIATISPCASSVDETLSTLRYAARAKRIQNRAKLNKGETNESVERHLKSEIARLRKLLATRSSGSSDQVGVLKQHLDAYKDELRRRTMTYREKVAEMRKKVQEVEKKLNTTGVASQTELKKFKMEPRLVNISADPSLTGNLVYILKSQKNQIGSNPECHITLISQDSSIKPEHAVMTKTVVTQDHARSEQVAKWELKFQECDNDGDGELCFSEFQTFVSTLVGETDEFNDLTEVDFVQICDKVQSEKQSLNWDHIQQLFGMIFEKEAKEEKVDEECKLAVSGIPNAHLNGRLVSDVRKYVFKDGPNRVFIDDNKIVAVFDTELPDTVVEGFSDELKSLLNATVYAEDVKVEKLSSARKGGISQVIIRSADPKDDSLMIFVNGVRIQSEYFILNHGDRIVFGTYHEFEFINPQNTHNSRTHMARQLSVRNHQKNLQVGGENLIINAPRSSFTQGASQIRRRKRRDTSVTMDQYRMTAQAVSRANDMCEAQGKPIMYSVGTMAYYDIDSYRRADLMVVTRSSRYTDPDMQHVMNMHEFQSELGEMSIFYRMLKDKSEDECIKVLGDNAFLPCNLETCAGRAQFTLQSKSVSDEPVSIPIVQNQAKIGRIQVQLLFKINGKQYPSPVNLDKIVKKKNITIELRITNLEFETEMKNVFLVYTFIGEELHKTGLVGEEMSTNHYMDHSKDFHIPLFSRALSQYLCTSGITFTVWGSLFGESELPPILSQKPPSSRIRFIVKLPNNQHFEISAFESHTIDMVKRRLQEETGIKYQSQILSNNEKELPNAMTVSEAEIKPGGSIQLVQSGDAGKESVDVINSHIQKIVPSPQTLEECRKQNSILRERLAQALSMINNFKSRYESKLWEGKFKNDATGKMLTLVQHSDGKTISIIQDTEPIHRKGFITGRHSIKIPSGKSGNEFKEGKTENGKTVEFDDGTTWTMLSPKNISERSTRRSVERGRSSTERGSSSTERTDRSRKLRSSTSSNRSRNSNRG